MSLTEGIKRYRKEDRCRRLAVCLIPLGESQSDVIVTLVHHDIEVEVKVEVTPDDAAICRDLAGQLEQPRPERRNAEWPRGISNLMHRPD
jgi:hypothetical protein